MRRRTHTSRKLKDLKALLAGKGTMLILLQNNPDPDAIAAAMGLRELAHVIGDVQCSLACGGTVGRSENRAMVRYLALNIRPMSQVDPARFDVIAIVDGQPGQGNISLPEGVSPAIVIDHHPIRPATRQAAFTDVRSRYGATSTIVYEYLREAGAAIDPPLATGLVYGIRSDTQDFGRDGIAADIEAHTALYPLANKRMLGIIQRGEVGPDYFRMLRDGLDTARRSGPAVFASLGEVTNPDMIGEVADLLVRLEDVDWSLVWGYWLGSPDREGSRSGVPDGMILLSVRCLASQGRADTLARRIVYRKGTGGGHRTTAGGQIPFPTDNPTSRRRLDKLIRRRFLRAVGGDPDNCREITADVPPKPGGPP